MADLPEKPIAHVTSEGQTVVSVKDLLASPKVQAFIREFHPKVQKYIAATWAQEDKKHG